MNRNSNWHTIKSIYVTLQTPFVSKRIVKGQWDNILSGKKITVLNPEYCSIKKTIKPVGVFPGSKRDIVKSLESLVSTLGVKDLWYFYTSNYTDSLHINRWWALRGVVDVEH